MIIIIKKEKNATELQGQDIGSSSNAVGEYIQKVLF